MFKVLFAVFALIAAAFAAPSPAPAPQPSPVANPSPVVTYGAPLAYSGYHVPVATYSSYSHVVPTAYTYGAPLVYH